MKKLSALLSALLFVFALSACAGQAPAQPTVEPTVHQMDEAQLRQKLAELGENGGPEEKKAIYEELLARDAFTEADYEGLAESYGKSGEKQLRRDTLLKLLLLYPTEEHARQLSEIVADRSEQPVCAALAEEALGCLRGGDAAAMKELVLSEEWNGAFQDGLRAVEIRSVFAGESGLLQVRAGYQETELSYLEPSGSCFYFRTESGGTELASAQYTEGAYNGEMTVNYYDAEGELLISYSGVLANNIFTGELLVTYEEKEFTGSLNEDGTTAEKQENQVEGLIYARSGNSYLYMADAAEDMVFDCAAVGLPVYEPWED